LVPTPQNFAEMRDRHAVEMRIGLKRRGAQEPQSRHIACNSLWVTATTTHPDEARRDDSVLMLYESYASAEVAVEALARAGLDMRHVSGVGRDAEPDVALTRASRPGSGARFTAGAWRHLSPKLEGRDRLVIPDVGRLVVMGPLAHRIAIALRREVVGGSPGMLREVLIGIGVPDGSVARCGLAVKEGGVLIVRPPSWTIEREHPGRYAQRPLQRKHGSP